MMLIKELTWNGLLIWPPHWVEESHEVIEHGLLKSVEILPLTELIKIDAAVAGTTISGLIFSTEQCQGSLYHKLKNNIGKPLKEVGNMEVYF
jgi:hypothetical protein